MKLEEFESRKKNNLMINSNNIQSIFLVGIHFLQYGWGNREFYYIREILLNKSSENV